MSSASIAPDDSIPKVKGIELRYETDAILIFDILKLQGERVSCYLIMVAIFQPQGWRFEIMVAQRYYFFHKLYHLTPFFRKGNEFLFLSNVVIIKPFYLRM